VFNFNKSRCSTAHGCVTYCVVISTHEFSRCMSF